MYLQLTLKCVHNLSTHPQANEWSQILKGSLMEDSLRTMPRSAMVYANTHAKGTAHQSEPNRAYGPDQASRIRAGKQPAIRPKGAAGEIIRPYDRAGGENLINWTLY